MGAWGHGIMANDSALDTRGFFTDYIKSEEMIYDAFDKLIKNHVDDASNWDILAIVNMAVGMGLLSKEMKEVAIEIIDAEIKNMPDWVQPEKRVKVLKGFKAYLETFEFEGEGAQ